MNEILPQLELKVFDIEKFGNDVLIHRSRLGLTRAQYSEVLSGSSGASINDIETKRSHNPKISLVYNICKWMEVDINNYFINK